MIFFFQVSFSFQDNIQTLPLLPLNVPKSILSFTYLLTKLYKTIVLFSCDTCVAPQTLLASLVARIECVGRGG